MKKSVSPIQITLSLDFQDIAAIARYLNRNASSHCLPLPCDLGVRDKVLVQLVGRASLGWPHCLYFDGSHYRPAPPLRHPEIDACINRTRGNDKPSKRTSKRQ